MKLRLRSQRQEAAIAKQLGGKVVPGSGCIRNPYLKEDVTSRTHVVQAKFTDKKSYTLKESEFAKTTSAALRQVKIPLWRIDFPGEQLAVLRWQDYIQFLSELEHAKIISAR